MFKGIHQPQSTLDFSIFVSIQGGHAQKSWGQINTLVSVLRSVRERRKALRMFWRPCGDWRDVSHMWDCLFRQSSHYLTRSLCLCPAQRERNT